MKLLCIAMLLAVFVNCVSKEVKVVDQAFEVNVQQKMQEMRAKERNTKIEEEASSRLQQEQTKGGSKESDNQMSPQEIKISFDLVQKNILSDDQKVQRAALDLFFKLHDYLSSEQISSVVDNSLCEMGIFSNIVGEKYNDARDMFNRIEKDLTDKDKEQVIQLLFGQLDKNSALEKINYDQIGTIFNFLFELVKKGILKNSSDIKHLFKKFKKLLLSEIEENKNNEQLVNLQAKVNLQSTGQYPKRNSSKLLGLLDGLLQKSQPGGWSTGLNLENKQIFQSLFDIVQAVAQESEPEVKSQGLWMLGKMVSN